MRLGKFISVEGVEGAGKSTVLKFVKSHLEQAGVTVACTREPGGTEIAEKIRLLLLHPDSDEKILPETELLLMFAGRAQHINQCIKPWLKEGKWVVSDRYIDATYAYQGGGRGLPKEFIAALDKHIVADIYPELTLLLDIPPESGFERAAQRGMGKDRIEREKLTFFYNVREAYLDRAQQDPNRFAVIDASKDLETVQQSVGDVLDTFLKKSASA